MEHPPYRLHESLGYQLSVASRLQERRLDEWIKPFGLTRITWCILLAVGNENCTRPSEIADFVGIDRTATSRALRQMEDNGLIARSAAVADRRMTDVALTAKGHDILAACTPLATDNNRVMSEKLSPEELKDLHRLLAKVSSGEEKALKQL